MSFRLGDGSRFRITDQQNKEVTLDSKIDPAKVKLQIDTDKDGKFDGKNDITITDEAQLTNLLDGNNTNNESIKNIPFVDEIATHVSKNSKINSFLATAEKHGKVAEETSIFQKNKKAENGRIAFNSVKSAYQTDPENPAAKFAYGMALLKIQKSAFSGMAEDIMGINLKDSIKKFVPVLEKDKLDILNQMLLREIYAETGNSAKANTEKNLTILKQNFPAEYKDFSAKFKEILEK